MCVGRYEPARRGGGVASIVRWNAKNRGDRYITPAMSLMAVYNAGRRESLNGHHRAARSPNRTSGPAFIVLCLRARGDRASGVSTSTLLPKPRGFLNGRRMKDFSKIYVNATATQLFHVADHMLFPR